jgi:hypothetical protein
MKSHLKILPLFLLITLSTQPSISAQDKTPYNSAAYGFSFDYPSSYRLKRFGDGYFDVLRERKILLRGSVEDLSFKVFIRESKPTYDVFRSFARERCKVPCGADGPDGSTYCETIESEREFVSPNGLRVLEFYLTMTRENYAENTSEQTSVGPVYLVDISWKNRPLALMISPGHGVLASESTKRVALELIDSLRLVMLGG